MSKKINIYINSSGEDLKSEATELRNFVNKLGDDLSERGYDVMIRPLPMKAEQFREEDIRDSEMCFFLFGHSSGEETEKNFDYAYSVFHDSKDQKPKVYVYFRKPEKGESADESIERMKEKIDGEYGHFYSRYDNLDTIKLRMLLNLKFQEMDYLPVNMDGDGLYLCGERVVELDKVGEFANCMELSNLRNEQEKTEKEYLDMCAKYGKEDRTDEFYRRYADVASRRTLLNERINELRKQIFELSLGLSRDSVSGDMTPRMKKAYKLLEEGDPEGCLAVLDEEETISDFNATMRLLDEKAKMVEKRKKKEASQFIREQKIAIDVLVTMYNDSERFDKIVKKYEYIVPVAIEYKTELDVVHEYASYLFDHGESQKAILELKDLLGLVEWLSAQDSLQYEPVLAASYSRLALFYSQTIGHMDEAEELFKKAITLQIRLVKSDSMRFEPDLAISYNNLADYYRKNSRHSDKVEELYRSALEINIRLAKQDPKQHEANLATSYNNLAVLYSDTHRFEEAETLFQQSLDVRDRLAKQNYQLFGPDLATTYNNLATLRLRTKRPKEAEEYSDKALEIQRRFAEQDPYRYEPDLLHSYKTLALIYSASGYSMIAAKYYYFCMGTSRFLADREPERYEEELADSYRNLGLFCYKEKRFAEAIKYLLDAVSVFRHLAAQDPDRYLQDLSRVYEKLAMLYSEMGRSEEAEKYSKKTSEIKEKLSGKS